jgi:hypothetical protein
MATGSVIDPADDEESRGPGRPMRDLAIAAFAP